MIRVTEELLARYYDGELSEGERKRVEQSLDASPEARESLGRLSRLSGLLNMMNDEGLAGVSFEGFDKRVINSLEEDRPAPGFGEKLKVWAEEFFAHRKVVWIPAASAATIAAAALLVLPLMHSQADASFGTGPQTGQVWTASTGVVETNAASEVALAAALQNTAATQYNLRGDRGESIAVLWINE